MRAHSCVLLYFAESESSTDEPLRKKSKSSDDSDDVDSPRRVTFSDASSSGEHSAGTRAGRSRLKRTRKQNSLEKIEEKESESDVTAASGVKSRGWKRKSESAKNDEAEKMMEVEITQQKNEEALESASKFSLVLFSL